MLRLVLGAIRRRRIQALLLFLLGAVAATIAATAPGYIAASVQSLAASNAGSAPPGERVIAVSSSLPMDSSPAQQVSGFGTQVAKAMDLPGFHTVLGAHVSGAANQVNTTVAYRDGVCPQIAIDGRCPTAPGEVVLSTAVATSTKLKAGDQIGFTTSANAKPVPLTVVGVFRARAPYDTYWGRSKAVDDQPVAGAQLPEFLILTPIETFARLGVAQATVSADLIATPEAFRATDPQVLIGAAQAGTRTLAAAKPPATVEYGMQTLTDRTWDEQQLVYIGVPVGAIELLLLCWFALFLAVRQTGEERRLDVAKLKLHGTRRRDIWTLIAGQSIVPLLLGGVVGLGLGIVLARAIAGPVAGATLSMLMVWAAVIAAAVAVLGAALAAILAERRILGESVAELGRQVGGRRSRWRSWLFDVAIAVLAVAATYQLGSGDLTGARLRGLAVAAPLLLALIAGLVTSRLVPIVASAVSPGLFRAGRVGAWLVSAHLARRAGRSRVLALLTLSLAVLGTTTLGWSVSSQARTDRARYEVGAEQMLTVQASSRTALLSGVRAADPSGRYAMAAVQTFGTLRVLAVDSTRLAAVVPWQDQYGIAPWGDVAALLHPTAPAPVIVTGSQLRLSANWEPAKPVVPGQVQVVASLLTTTGALTSATFGPLQVGKADYPATAAGCSADAPCRLVSVGLASAGAKSSVSPQGSTPASSTQSTSTQTTSAGSSTQTSSSGASGPDGAAPPSPGSKVVLSQLVQTDPAATVVATGAFADRAKWRNDVRPVYAIGQLGSEPDGLALSMSMTPTTATPPAFPGPAYVYDAVAPLPVVVTGKIPPAGDIGDSRAAVFGDTDAPILPVGTARQLPRLGQSGLLVDLEYGDRLLPGGSTLGSMQVWVANGAPADLPQRLAAHGVTVISVDSVANRLDALGAQGPVVALRFLLLVGAAGTLLALVSFAVWAGTERTLRGQELRSLRWQGLPSGATRVAAVGGYLATVAVAVVIGAAVALALNSVDSSDVFADNFTALTLPPADPLWMVWAVGAAALALAVAALIAGRAVLRVAGRGVAES